MKRKFIIDKEINLNEADFLKTKPYADNLIRIINNTEENKVFTIGLFGSWGSGKSSIIETASKGFDPTKVKFINYDAWQYANDSFRRMFLRNLRKELGLDESELMKKFYENESADIGYKYQLSTTKLLGILAGIFLVIGLIWVLPLETDFKVPVYSLLTLIGLFITVISGAFNHLKISISKPLFFAPEQFENCFKEMASVALKKFEWYENLIFTVAGNKAVKNLDKLVIVIDNIDRCNNDIAYQLLTDIKTFLANDNYSIVFVIPVDDEALRKHLFRINKLEDEDISVKEKEEFLRKFFNVVIRIKPYQETDMFEYAKKLNEKYKLGFKVDTVNLAAKEYSTNPRRVLQLFNNLMSDLSNYTEEFANNNETIICAVLILREEFSSYYRDVVNSPKIFFEDPVNENIENNKNIERIQRFNRITRNIKSNISVSTISYILTNSYSVYEDIPNDLKDAVNTFNTNFLTEYFDSEKEYSRIFEYIFYKTNVAFTNGLDSDLTSYFETLAFLNNKYNIDRSFNARFFDIFENRIGYIIEHTVDHNLICSYALKLSEQRIPQLRRKLISTAGATNSSMNYWPKLINAIILIIKDKECSESLSEVYEDNYTVINSETQLSEEQYQYLINERFIQKRIEGIQDLSLTDTSYLRVVDIFQNRKIISIETINSLISKVVLLAGDSFNKPQHVIIENIKYINSILSTLPDKKLETYNSNLEQFHNSIIQRKIADLNNPNIRRYDIDTNLIEASLHNDEELHDCINYLINVYRLTNNNIPIINELNRLNSNRGHVNERLVEILGRGVSLFPLFDFIKSDRNYSSDKTLILIRDLLINADYYYQLIEPLYVNTDIIDSLLEYAHENNNSNVFTLITELCTYNKLRETIEQCVINKSSDFINSLPRFLNNLAINKFTEENYLDYKGNFSFLEAIAKGGNETQVHLIILIVNDQLDRKNISTDLLSLITTLNPIRKSDRNLLKSHLEYAVESLSDQIDKVQLNRLEGIIRNLNK